MAKRSARVGKTGYVVPLRDVQGVIRFIRGQHVVLDQDLARMYGVETRVLVQAVKRNQARFPDDFLFQLNSQEYAALRSQSGASSGRGGRRYPPFAFTEHGALMVAGVLNSERAVEVSVFVVRAFVRMRRMLGAHRELAAKLVELEHRIAKHDVSIAALFNAIRQLMRLPDRTHRLTGAKDD